MYCSGTGGSRAAAVRRPSPRGRARRRARRARRTARGRASSGLMSISRIQRLLADHLAEADEQLLERVEVHAALAPDALQHLEDARLLHQPPRQRRVERRQAQRAILYTSTSLPPCPNRSTGPNCGSATAAEDQLVPVGPAMRCTVTPRKWPSPSALADRGRDGAEGRPHGGRVAEPKPHATDVGLVGDRLASAASARPGSRSGPRWPRPRPAWPRRASRTVGDAVGLQHLLGLDLGQQGAAGGAHLLQDGFCATPARRSRAPPRRAAPASRTGP